ncbi:MAG: type II toxin-antitoxin system HicB family antitoxin [Candidatus Edwardsbacteria bacterium]|nr:type II toxin-antitoxin system HicB family antitoxin [Candidatus Edwardsbacteria bacterium]
MKKFRINVNIFVEKDGDEFHAFCPTFRGLHTCGATRKEAVENVNDAIKAYVVSLLKHGEPIPCCEVIQDEYPAPKFHRISKDIQLSLVACA